MQEMVKNVLPGPLSSSERFRKQKNQIHFYKPPCELFNIQFQILLFHYMHTPI